MEMEMETSLLQAQIQKPIPISQKRERTRTRKRSHMGSHSIPGLKRHSLGRKQRRPAVVKKVHEDEEDVGDKIMALQRVVPGGEALGADKLFEETAGYILALQTQVKALRALTTFFEGLQKEKMKLGG